MYRAVTTEISLCESVRPGNTVKRKISELKTGTESHLWISEQVMFRGVNFIVFKLNLIYNSLLALKFSIWCDLIVLVPFILLLLYEIHLLWKYTGNLNLMDFYRSFTVNNCILYSNILMPLSLSGQCIMLRIMLKVHEIVFCTFSPGGTTSNAFFRFLGWE